MNWFARERPLPARQGPAISERLLNGHPEVASQNIAVAADVEQPRVEGFERRLLVEQILDADTDINAFHPAQRGRAGFTEAVAHGSVVIDLRRNVIAALRLVVLEITQARTTTARRAVWFVTAHVARGPARIPRIARPNDR